ncbi:MAG TPA: Plug domain-containing protein, partial [Longimicrobiales bacterium]
RALSRLDAFHERMKRKSFGYFIDQKAIERMPAHFVSDLLRRAPGTWVERNRVMMRGCSDALYLIDGMPVYPIGDETSTEAVNSMISPTDVEGIEVYRGDATVPMELRLHMGTANTAGSCGLIAIWTKR